MNTLLSFIKKRWRYILIAIIALIIGSSSGPSSEDYNKVVDKYNNIVKETKDLSKTVKEKDAEINKLQAKVDEAKPFFELSKQEQENKIKEANAKEEKLKAEEKARKEAAQKEQERKAKAKAAAELAARTKTLTAGKYKVGRDIDPGLYKATAISGQGNFVVSNDYDLKVNEMFGVGDPEFYNSKFNNLELEDGDTIDINSGLQIKFTPQD
ncbi:hypothetical protein [Rummeliibacillus pycnus]|uniref:hypothetical protein n=1 Tax=Rummeliibacillus pycnus TaxID=101070 RepID=UPI003D29996A